MSAKCQQMAIRKDTQRDSWVADYSVINNGVRKRQRKFFKSRAQAKAFLDTQNQSKLTYGQASSFDIEDYQRLKKLEHLLLPKTSGVKAESLVESFIEHQRSKVCKEHLVNLRCYLKKFISFFHGTEIMRIGLSELEEFFSAIDYANETKNNVRRSLYTMFEFAKMKKQIKDNPVADLSMFVIETRAIEFISVKDTETLLRHLQASRPQLIPRIALRAFAGMRTEHTARLTWDNINFEEQGIRIEAQGKARASFLEGHPPNLWRWLEKYKSQPLLTKDTKALRAEVQKIKMQIPRNGLRHGFATYHIAKFRDAGLTQLLMQHQGNSRVLWNKYRGVTSRKEASRFFSIQP